MGIQFNIKSKRFTKNGKFVSKTNGLKSSIARKQYNKYIKSSKKNIPVIKKFKDKSIDLSKHEKLDLYIDKDITITKYFKDYLNYTEDKKNISGKNKDWYNSNQQLKTVYGHIMNKYKRIASNKFAYIHKSELNKKYNVIVAYYNIYDVDRGFTVMRFLWRTKKLAYLTVKQLENKIKNLYHQRFINGVLKTLSVKDNTEYYFKSIILWGSYDNRKYNNLKAGESRNNKINKGRK